MSAAIARLIVVSMLIGAGAVTAASTGANDGRRDAVFKPFKLTALDGSRITLSDVLGQATLIVFFFPTCTYCNVALPEMQKLHDDYKDRGLSVVWINVVPEQEPLISQWRTRHGYTVPILLGGRSLQKDYSLTMTPTHYLLDASGKVVSRQVGYKRGELTALERRIREALGVNE